MHALERSLHTAANAKLGMAASEEIASAAHWAPSLLQPRPLHAAAAHNSLTVRRQRAATLQSLDRHKAARGCPQVMETPPSGRVVCAPGIRLCHLQSPGALASRPPLWAIARVPQTQVPGCERSPRRLLIPDLPSPRPCPESVMRRVEAGQSPSLVAPAPREPLLDLARRLITAARGRQQTAKPFDSPRDPPVSVHGAQSPATWPNQPTIQGPPSRPLSLV
ncbi:hypothetical protein ACCO45_002948 [Purpureocillium lilacinum]|uniref:Uncharacterized protein n=1 Tax=Purpureocillium lilacinum TaxID=33203 RepID=A0ACC4DYF8_PURLI